jgi:hypothetical protein
MGGLGTLQTEILASLEEAKRDRRGYRGFGGESGDHWPPGHKWTLPGWVLIAGTLCAWAWWPLICALRVLSWRGDMAIGSPLTMRRRPSRPASRELLQG